MLVGWGRPYRAELSLYPLRTSRHFGETPSPCGHALFNGAESILWDKAPLWGRAIPTCHQRVLIGHSQKQGGGPTYIIPLQSSSTISVHGVMLSWG